MVAAALAVCLWAAAQSSWQSWAMLGGLVLAGFLLYALARRQAGSSSAATVSSIQPPPSTRSPVIEHRRLTRRDAIFRRVEMDALAVERGRRGPGERADLGGQSFALPLAEPVDARSAAPRGRRGRASARPRRAPLSRLERDDVERLGLAADLEAAALADGEMDQAAMARRAPAPPDRRSRRAAPPRAAASRRCAHNRRRGRSRCPGCRACRRRAG